MLFDKNDVGANERILYTTRPNMILGCKNAIFGVVLLVIVIMASSLVIKFIGKLQVYLISQVQLPLTRYAAIAFFVIILITVIYIIWQLVGWYSLEYTLTESRIIVKSGVLSTKKNYMHYHAIQDINTSQSFVAKMLNVGTLVMFSAYDNNQIELKNISNPSDVEEIIFSKMVAPRNFQPQPQPQRMPPRNNFYENEHDTYLGRNEVYDEYEPITPITHERNLHPRREYEYYPNMNEDNPRHKYEYEPYNTGFDNNYSNSGNSSIRDDYYEESEYYPTQSNDYYENTQENIREPAVDDGSEDVIKRHFDKFKR